MRRTGLLSNAYKAQTLTSVVYMALTCATTPIKLLHENHPPYQTQTSVNIHHAIRMAQVIEQPLDIFVTINFSQLDFNREHISAAFGKLRCNSFAHWLRRPSRHSGLPPCKPTFAWVIEAANGTTAAHWLLHVPTGRLRDFKSRLPVWLAKVTGCSEAETNAAVQIKRAYRPKGAGRYMLKGMEETYAKFYGVRFEAQGVVHNKRAGISQNLGPKVKRGLREQGLYPKAKPFAIGQMRDKSGFEAR